MIARTVQRQARQAITSLIMSLENCPDDIFAKPIAEYKRPLAGLAAHAIRPMVETLEADALMSSGCDAWPLRDEFTRAEVISCATHILDVVIPDYLDSNDMSDIDPQPEYFVSRLDRILKVLRHVAHHTGEINCILRGNGIERGRFMGR